MIKAEDIKPERKNESDFFSWNLYRWFKKYPNECRIYKDGNGTLCIGDRSTIVHGAGLVDIHRKTPRSSLQSCRWAYLGSNYWQDVTEEFFSEYMSIGVCAINGISAHKWIEKGDYRECQYCEKEERKIVTMVEKITWEAIK